MRSYKLFFGFFLLIGCSFQVRAFPEPHINAKIQPSLGAGYDSKTGDFRLKRVEGKKNEYVGRQKSEWKVIEDINAEKKALKISGSAELSIDYNVFSGTGKFDLEMVTNNTKQSVSISGIYEIEGKNCQILAPSLLPEYNSQATRVDAHSIFGDQFVSSVQLGGRLFLDVTVDYSDNEESSNIGGGIKVNISKLIKGSADARVINSLKSKNIDVSVRAIQIGGDASQLSGMFGSENNLKSCSKGNLEECFELIDNVLKYSKEFGEQLNGMKYDPSMSGGPAIVGIALTKYSEEGIQIGPKNSNCEEVQYDNRRLRENLTKEYLRLLADHNYIKRRQKLGYSCTEYNDILNTIDYNADILVRIIENTESYPDKLKDEYKRYKDEKKKYTDPDEIKVKKEIDSSSPLGQLFDAVEKKELPRAIEQIKAFGPKLLREYNEDGETPFHCAVRKGQDKMVKMLLDQEERYKPKEGTAAPLELTALQCDSVEGYTPLCIAAKGGTYEHILCMNILRAAGAGVDCKSAEGLTPLQVAARCGKLDTTRKLLSIGGKDDVRDVHGRTLLHLAAGSGNADLIEYLIKERGFAIDAHDEDLMTPLHIAASRGHIEAVKCLINLKAKIDAEDLYGNTALVHGLAHEGVVKILLPYYELPMSLHTLSGGWVTSVAFSRDGWTLASRHTLSWHKGRVNSVAFSRDGSTLASSAIDDNTVKLWHTQSGALLHTLSGHKGWVNSVAFSRDGSTLVSASSDNTVKLWHTQSGALLHTLSGHKGSVYSVAFSRDGSTLASASHDKTVKLWHTHSGALLHTLSGHKDYVKSVAFSRDGSTLASASGDKTVKLWHTQSGALLHTLSGHNDWVYSVAFSRDGSTLASGSFDKTVKLWRTQSGALLHTLSGHNDWVKSVAFSSDGSTLASGSWDSTVKLWQLRWDSILHQAVRGGNLGSVKRVVKKFPILPFIRTPQGQSPVELAEELLAANEKDSVSELAEIVDFLRQIDKK